MDGEKQNKERGTGRPWDGKWLDLLAPKVSEAESIVESGSMEQRSLQGPWTHLPAHPRWPCGDKPQADAESRD